MMKTNTGFAHFVLRSSLLPVSEYFKFIDHDGSPLSKIRLISKSPAFMEAVYVASPELYASVKKMSESTQVAEDKKSNKIFTSILKYLTRATFRATPFGLFAGCTLGNFKYESNETTFQRTDKTGRSVKLDMEFLSNLIMEIEQSNDIKTSLNYFANNSWFKKGANVRFLEYIIINKRKFFNVSQVQYNRYLKKILALSAKGASFLSLIKYLMQSGFDESESEQFILELISCKLLISDIGLDITTDMNFCKLLNTLEQKKYDRTKLDYLNKIQLNLEVLNASLIGENFECYENINNEITNLNLTFTSTNVFHVDLKIKNEIAELPALLSSDIDEAVDILYSLVGKNRSHFLEDFKQKFKDKFQNKRVPLLEALDPEMGINVGAFNTQPAEALIDQFLIKEKKVSSKVTLTQTTLKLLNKVLGSQKGKKHIELLPDDFQSPEEPYG